MLSDLRLLMIVSAVFAGAVIVGCDAEFKRSASDGNIKTLYEWGEVSRTVAGWDEKWGNHRAAVTVDQNTQAVWTHIPWRRCDKNPENKAIVVRFWDSNESIKNVFINSVNNEYGDIIFEPEFGKGQYHIYYMPIAQDSGWLSQTKYLEPNHSASPQWLKQQGLDTGKLSGKELLKFPKAELTAIQAVSDWDNYSEMEIIAAHAEVEKLLSRHPQKKYLIFPEDRTYPVRMRHYLPLRWINRGSVNSFSGEALRNEFYVYQLGIYAAKDAVNDVKVVFEPLKPQDENCENIPTSAMQCFNLGGVDWLGNNFTKSYSLEKGLVGALWIGVQIPPDARPGLYKGTVLVQPSNQQPTRIAVQLKVGEDLFYDCGDSEIWKHSRLRWLNSRIALDDSPTKGFEPLKVSNKSISCMGRKVSLADNGLPTGIQSYFSASVTKILAQSREILAEPIRFSVVDSDDKVLNWTLTKPVTFTKKDDGKVTWESQSKSSDLTLNLHATMEFDGYIEYKLNLSAAKSMNVKDIYLDVPYKADLARYMMGMGYKGAARPEKYNWKWNVKRKRDSVWIGDVSAGLRCQLKGENYSRPFVNIYYHYKPLMMPPAWHNEGKGGAVVEQVDSEKVVLHAFSGSRTIHPHQPLNFDFTLLVTPFKTVNTKAHWANRYHHKYHKLDEPCDVKKMGANIINIHQGNIYNPYINYPFLTVDELKKYISKAHNEDLRVKLYYTVRELSNHTVELWALRSFGDEILAYGHDRPGNSWLQEHLVDNYLSAWYEKRTKDAAVITAGMSRWHNYYLEGLDFLTKKAGIDGLYLDGIAYDRDVMKRVRKILERNRPAPLIDLHDWDNSKFEAAGMESSANIYMEHLPYIDRLWFGECYDYDKLSSDFWLIELSGIPFGLMGEMLDKGGNPWCGMVYGMTNRLGWGGHPQELWKFWDEFGIQDAEMIGYWDESCPVITDNEFVKATVYKKQDKILIAVANWADKKVDVHLKIKKGYMLNPQNPSFVATPIKDFQPQATFNLTDAIPIESRKGFLLILDGIKGL